MGQATRIRASKNAINVLEAVKLKSDFKSGGVNMQAENYLKLISRVHYADETISVV